GHELRLSAVLLALRGRGPRDELQQLRRAELAGQGGDRLAQEPPVLSRPLPKPGPAQQAQAVPAERLAAPRGALQQRLGEGKRERRLQSLEDVVELFLAGLAQHLDDAARAKRGQAPPRLR